VRNVVVGRQPIFDRTATVHGYEVLCRPPAGGDGDLRAMEVASLVTSVSLGLDRLVGRYDAHLPVDRTLLELDTPFVLPPERTVLQVDAPSADDEVGRRCRELRAAGYRLAVDQRAAEADPAGLLGIASFVKVDVRAADRSVAAELVRWARHHEQRSVATNIDLRQELVECDQLGFDLFQGYLLAQPRTVPGTGLDPSRLATVRLAAALLDSEVALASLEEIVRSDPVLTHQLLALAGAGAAGGLRRTVRTVREALVLAGWRRLQSWVALLLLAGSGQPSSTEEVTVALVRARACELVAQAVAPELADAAFAAGMLSTFDLLLHVPLADALAGLPLDGLLVAAVIDRQGPLGAIVSDVVDLQFGRHGQPLRSGVDPGTAQRAMFEATMWSVGASSALDNATTTADR